MTTKQRKEENIMSKAMSKKDRETIQDGVLYFATQDDAEESIKAHEREWKIFYGMEEK